MKMFIQHTKHFIQFQMICRYKLSETKTEKNVHKTKKKLIFRWAKKKKMFQQHFIK